MSWMDIPGWFDFDDIYREAVDTAPTNAVLVEIGVAFGRSLAHLARYAISCRRHDLKIYGIDPWVDDWTTPVGWAEEERPTWGGEHAEWARQQGGPFSAFVQMMREHAPEELERVHVIRGQGHLFAGVVGPAHMAFLDGDHRYGAVARDIRAWCGSTILAGHDYTSDFPGVQDAVHDLVPGAVARGTSWYRPVAA